MSEGRSGGYTETRAIHCRPGMEFEFHPLADVFPAMSAGEFDALVKDIGERGQLEPVALYEGRVLDGRHRVRACRAAGRDVEYHNLGEDVDPVRYVVGANLRRRHLTPSQKAALAADLEHGVRGRPGKAATLHGFSREDATEITGANVRSTAKASEVKRKAPELHEEVRAGTFSVDDAVKVADKPAEVRKAALEMVAESGGATTLSKAVMRIEAAALEDSEAARTEPRQSELPNTPLPPVAVKVACSLEGEFKARDAAGARRKAVLELSKRLRGLDAGGAKELREQAAEVGVSLDVTVPKG